MEGVIVPAFCFELSVQRRFCRGLFRPFTLPSHTITGLPLAVIFRIHAQPFSSIPAISFDTTGYVIQVPAGPLKPFAGAGERGLGRAS